MNKTPAFQWYAKDFLSDANVIKMTASEVGAYILLISICWVEGSLPNDLEDLSLLAKTPLEQFKISWNKRLSVCFVLNEKANAFFHPRLQKEIKKQKEFRQKKSNAGKESGRKRRENRELRAEHVFNSVQTKAEQTRTLLSSSSSSTTLKNKETTEAVVKKATATKISDEEWLSGLEKSIAYKHANVLIEFERAKVWCANNNRQPTRRFFVGWLNRILRPMEIQNNGTIQKPNGNGYKPNDAGTRNAERISNTHVFVAELLRQGQLEEEQNLLGECDRFG